MQSKNIALEKRIVSKIQEIEELSIELQGEKVFRNSFNFIINFFGVILILGTLIRIGAIN